MPRSTATTWRRSGRSTSRTRTTKTTSCATSARRSPSSGNTGAISSRCCSARPSSSTPKSSERRSLILVNPGLAPKRASVYDHVHRLPAQRSQRDHAAAPAFAERDPPRPHRLAQFHRRRGREHHLRPRRHGADAARHLAQSRQPGQRPGDQPLRPRPAAGRDPERHVFRARLHRGRGRQARQARDAVGALLARLLAARLWRGRPAAALRLAHARHRQRLADVCLSLGHDARGAGEVPRLGRRPLRSHHDRVRRIRSTASRCSRPSPFSCRCCGRASAPSP